MSKKLHVTAVLKINPNHIKEAEPYLRKLAEESEKEDNPGAAENDLNFSETN